MPISSRAAVAISQPTQATDYRPPSATTLPAPQFNGPPAYVQPGSGSPGFPVQQDPNELSEADKAEFNRLAREMTSEELRDYIEKQSVQQSFV